MQDLQCAFCSQDCSWAKSHRGRNYDCVFFYLHTCWYIPTHVQSKPSSDFALRQRLPKLVYKTCAHIRRGSYPNLERRVDVCVDNVKSRGLKCVWKMFGFYAIKRYEMRMLHISFNDTCICLTFNPLSLHKVWKWLWFCEKEATINYHHGSAVKLRNTCRGSLTQRLVS